MVGRAHGLCCRRLAGLLCSPLGLGLPCASALSEGEVSVSWWRESRANISSRLCHPALGPGHPGRYMWTPLTSRANCISGYCSSQSFQEQGWKNLLHLLWNTQVNVILSWVMTVFQQWYHLTSKAGRWCGLWLRHSEWVCCKGQCIFIAHHQWGGAED